MNTKRQGALAGLTRDNVVEVRGDELDALIARLASEGKRIIILEPFKVSRWRCTTAQMPAGASSRPNHLNTRPPVQKAAVGGAGRFRGASPQIPGPLVNRRGEAMMTKDDN